MSGLVIIQDDCSDDTGPYLAIRRDNQGDLYFFINESLLLGGNTSKRIRLCGPGGGSKNPGLAVELAKVLFKKEEEEETEEPPIFGA
jgi:hypothetical protein